ncbi:nuclear transport factor 2 family protein [Burkholderia territorii]|uniref:nuclear transport factor 2 family protein n=1 Tax=Burkholderia territorii TaxID=1503055 RepID=UPI0007BA0864|nr:nuclear transport factor 2 family protein [Burkholderia territorii]
MSADVLTPAFEFALEVYQAVDSMDERLLLPYLTEDCAFVFGNREPLIGHASIAEGLRQFSVAIAGLHHRLLDVWQFDDVIVSRIEVTYVRHDKSRVAVPAATIWRLRDRKIFDNRIYIDNTPVFEGGGGRPY